MEGLEFISFTDTEKRKLDGIIKSDKIVGYVPRILFGFREIKEPSYLSQKFETYTPGVYRGTYDYALRYNDQVVGFLAIWNGVSPFAEDQSPDIDFWFVDYTQINLEEATGAVFNKLRQDFR